MDPYLNLKPTRYLVNLLLTGILTFTAFLKGDAQPDTTNCLKFTGSNYIDCGNPSGNLFDFTGEGTIEAWVKITAFPRRMDGSTLYPILAMDEGPGDINKWIFGVHKNGLGFHINSPNEMRDGAVSRPFTVMANKCYHFAITKDKGNKVTFYINGINMGSSIVDHATPFVNAPLLIGGAEPRFFMKGEIYEVRFWKKALTGDEIKAWIFREVNASHPQYASLAACFRLSEIKGTTIVGQKGITARLENGPIPLWDAPFLPVWLIVLIFAALVVLVLSFMLYRMWRRLCQEKIDMRLFAEQMSHENNNGIGMMINILSVHLNENGLGHIEAQLKRRLQTIADMQSAEYILPGEKEIAFRKYITDLIEKMNLAFNQGKQVVYDMDLPERVKAKYATKLAILIRELTLNSLKHAFRGRINGEINISIKPAGKGLFRFEFCDNGSGIAAKETAALSVGTALISAVSSQLGGKPEVFSANGYKFVLLFKQ